eukprot:6194703-Pleurochrysis_carterae.AAC.3
MSSSLSKLCEVRLCILREVGKAKDHVNATTTMTSDVKCEAHILAMPKAGHHDNSSSPQNVDRHWAARLPPSYSTRVTHIPHIRKTEQPSWAPKESSSLNYDNL